MSLNVDSSGRKKAQYAYETPKGTLYLKQETSQYTTFDTEPLIKNKADFEIYAKYWPVPASVDYSNVENDKKRLGEKGIMRTYGINYYYGQISPWQCLCYLMGTEPAIIAAIDDPKWVNYALEIILQKALKVIELSAGCPIDLIEIGGGAASNTVISPAMFEEFCLPYDKIQHQALHNAGTKVTYHLCGGLMPFKKSLILISQ